MTDSIRDDSFSIKLLEKIPKDKHDIFTDEHLLVLKAALGARSWGRHAIDLRWTSKFWRMKPVYRSTATVLIEPDTSNVVSIEEVYGVGKSDEEYYKTQYKILESRVLAERVIDRLSLADHPEFLPDEQSYKFRLTEWV